MNKHASPLVVKYGGHAVPGAGERDPLLDEIAAMAREAQPLVLVHGGGPEIDEELRRRGVAIERVDGLRVTGAVTLAVTEAVLCATINKRLVRALHARGANAVGISGADGGLVHATRMRNPALGFVGEIERVDASLLRTLLDARYVPVVAPLAVSPEFAPLNVNADIAAAAIAVALKARSLVFITNVPRILRDPSNPESGIERMTPDEATAFHASPACSDGMRPKLEAAIVAASHGIDVCVAGSGERALQAALAGNGTIIAGAAPAMI